MAETITKPRSVVKTPVVSTETTRQLSIPPVRLGGVVDRASKLSDDVLTSLETGERSAIEAVGQFVIAVEEALPQEVLATSDVAKKRLSGHNRRWGYANARSCGSVGVTGPQVR
jgi:hypothetical protein